MNSVLSNFDIGFLAIQKLIKHMKFIQTFSELSRGEKSSATGKQAQSSAFNSSPKYMKEWRSVGLLKLNASQQKSKLSHRIFSCNLTIL